MPLRRAARGFTLIELLIVIAIIGIIAAILIPNFLDALHKGKQKRTMGGMRDAGSAWFAWLSDQYGGAAAAGAEVTKYPLPETDYGYEQTQADLVPVYIQELIESDGWGNPLVYCRAPDDDLQTESSVLAILSPGRDGQPGPVVNAGCGVEVEFGAFEPTAYDLDIVWADGFFVRFPQKTSAGG
jgi:prepilin-type N-terminal cleavage/methylation domain-containing protein